MFMPSFPRRALSAARRLAPFIPVVSAWVVVASLHATTITPVPINGAYDSVSGDYQMQVDDGTGANSSVVSVLHHYVTITGSNYTNAYLGHFAFTGGTARITLSLSQFNPSSTFTTALTPTATGLAATRVAGTNQVQITIPPNQHPTLMLHVSDSANTYPSDLIIAADPAESDLYSPPPSSGTGIYNTSSYGTSDGYSIDCGPAINNAISAAHSYYTTSGSIGVVYVPKATAAGSVYKIATSIVPMNGVSLYLPAGVILRADTTYQDWTAWQNQSPHQLGQSSPAVYMIDGGSGDHGSPAYSVVQNFMVYGRGTIDCQGVKLGGGVPYASSNLRIAAARICDSQNITFNGVVIREATAITFDLDRDEALAFVDTKVLNYGRDHNYRQNDGMDLYQCQNASANHCFIFTADDAVALKGAYSSTDTAFQTINNVTYNDMVVWTTVNGLKFGNSAYTNVTNSYFSNSDIVSAEYGISIEANSATAAKTWSGLGYYNITADAVTTHPVQIESLSGYTNVSNVNVNDFSYTGTAASTLNNSNTNGGSLGAVSFRDLTINGAVALSNSAANLTVSGSASQPTYGQDSNLLTGLTPTANSGNWYASPNSYTALNDGNTGSQAQTTGSTGQVTYNLGSTKWIDRAQLYQDYGNFDCQYWRVEYYNGTWNNLFPSGVIDYDVPASLASQGYTTAGVSGWNVTGFPPVQASQIRITFQSSSGNLVGVNEVAIYGH